MHKISATTHKFRRGKVPGDGTCLFWSGLLVFKCLLINILGEDFINSFLVEILTEDLFNSYLTEILNVDLFKLDFMEKLNGALRSCVTNYIENRKDIHDLVENSTDERYPVADYCSLIELGELWGGALELRMLSSLSNRLVYVICAEKRSGKQHVYVSCYGEDNHTATQCVFILYDKETVHYDPLYVVNTQNPNEKETVFERNDKVVIELIKKFIKEDLKYDGDVDRNFLNCFVVDEVLPPTDDSNDFEKIPDLLLSNLPLKRKVTELEDIVLPPNEDKQLPVLIPDEYYNQNKRVKIDEDTTERKSRFHKDDAESMKIESLIQGERIADKPDQPVAQQQIEDLPMVSNEELRGKMDLEIKPGQELDGGDKFKCDNELSKEKLSP